VIRRLALTVSNVCFKLGCFQSTHSVLEVSHFMRYVNSRLTYLLAYFVELWEETKWTHRVQRVSSPTVAGRGLPSYQPATASFPSDDVSRLEKSRRGGRYTLLPLGHEPGFVSRLYSVGKQKLTAARPSVPVHSTQRTCLWRHRCGPRFTSQFC